MRTMSRINRPTEQEIIIRRRLREACDFFAKLNEESLAVETPAGEPNFLPAGMVERISAYVSEKLNPGDLMAIRETPFKWAVNDPYKWLWILHRYMNSQRR